MAAAKIESKVRAHGTMHVKLPAKVAYRPAALKKSIRDLMEQLGCSKCFSGANCLFTHERDFIVEARGALKAIAGPTPDPWATRPVTVSLASGPRFDIDKVFRSVDKVIDIIGSCPCHSGIDVFYLNELTVIGVNEKLEANQFGG